MGTECRDEMVIKKEENLEEPSILEQVVIDELAVDGICGIY
jgi:hypothetical protein